MEEIGPVEYMIVSFPGNQFTGEIAPALGQARRVEHDPDHRPGVRRQGRGRGRRSIRAQRRRRRVSGAASTRSASKRPGLLGEEDLIDAADGPRAGLVGSDAPMGGRLGSATSPALSRAQAASSSRSSASRTTSSGGARGPAVRRRPPHRRPKMMPSQRRSRSRSRDDSGRRGDCRCRPAPAGPEVRRAGPGGIRRADGRPAGGAPAAPAAPDYAAELEQLAQLKAQGILTDEEFEAKKKQILGI